jgi:hypothetical protein
MGLLLVAMSQKVDSYDLAAYIVEQGVYSGLLPRVDEVAAPTVDKDYGGVL